jgi:TM2 domain-containing membrane protein YozV
VLSTLSQNKIQPTTAPTVVIAPQNAQSSAKVAETKANTTKVKSTKPKGNRTKMILLGLLAYLTLSGTMAVTKHLKDTKNAKATYGGSCKSWVVALVLCWLLGGLGIHRFYLGYIWQGVVQLLTGGGCGIWWLIDWIRIIMKDLNPKDGDYC